MSRKVAIIAQLLKLSVAMLILCSLTAAQSRGDVPDVGDSADDYSPADTTFIKIILTDDGVIALDTAGYDWYYDFSSDQFLPGLPDALLPTEYRHPSEDEELTIEERCTELKRVREFESDRVIVGFDEYVEGNITTYGRVTVKGWVQGDVRSFSKVVITRTGRVDGDIQAPRVDIRNGAEVYGAVIETGPLDIPFSVDGMIIVTCFTGFFLLIAFLAGSLMPNHVMRFNNCFQRYKGRTYLIGFLSLMVFPLLVALLAITIVGLLAIPLLPLLYLLAITGGVMSVGSMIGNRIFRQVSGNGRPKLIRVNIGSLLFMGLWFIVAGLMGSPDETANDFGVFFLVIAILASTFPVLSGLGAAILTRFGFREYVSWKHRQQGLQSAPAPAPAPPPMPAVSNHIDPPEPPAPTNYSESGPIEPPDETS